MDEKENDLTQPLSLILSYISPQISCKPHLHLDKTSIGYFSFVSNPEIDLKM